MFDFNKALVSAYPELYKKARKICGRSDAAHDLCQSTVVSAIENKEKFSGGSFTGWLFTIMRNLWRMEYNRGVMMMRNRIKANPETSRHSGDAFYSTLLNEIARQFRKLPEDIGKDAYQVWAEEWSVSELARHKGVNKSVVCRHVQRAREALVFG